MKLGLVVVYLVSEGNEGLLDLHLERIARHTRMPHTIYAAAARLRPDLRERLAARPGVRICTLAPTAERKSAEHAHYLERLSEIALEDGASHVAMLHVDSFPIRDGWDETLASSLTPERPFAAAVRDLAVDDKPFTACLFSGAEFLRRWQPRLLLSDAERRSATYRRYRRRHPHHPDSGVGFGLLAFRHGLEWVRLERTNRGEDHGHFGAIHGDLVFHLGAASWRRKDFPARREPTAALALRRRLAAVGRRLLPRPAREPLKSALGSLAPALDIERKYDGNEAAFAAVRDRLLEDPEGYLRYLRDGAR